MAESNISWIDNYKRKHPAYGTIEQRDDKGTVLSTIEGIIVGRGDSKRVVDPQEVFELAKLHCTYNEISEFLDINVETLKYNFRDLIINGYNITKQKLRSKQIQVALDGNVTMLIWLGKQILLQSENPGTTDNSQVLPWQETESTDL